MGSIGNFLKGFFTYIKAIFFILFHPSLYFSFILPLIINALMILPAVFYGYKLYNWINSAGLHFLVRILAYSCGFFGTVFFYFFISSIIASWFYKGLAKKTEMIVTGKASDVEEEGFFLFQIFLKLFWLIKKLIFICAGLCLNVIPGVGNAFSLMILSYYVAFNCLETTLSLKGFSMSKKIDFCGKRKAEMIGFGLAATILSASIVLSIFSVPIGVVGGTLLAIEDDDNS